MFGFVQATPGNGVTSATLRGGQRRKTTSDAKISAHRRRSDPTITNYWQARINTKGSSDLYILENRIAPGGTFGWHSHRGAGNLVVEMIGLQIIPTLYLADDPACTGHVVEPAHGFVDDGSFGDVHVVRDEGTV